MFWWTICPKQLITTTLKEMPVSVLSIKYQGQRQSIPYNCSDSNSKWGRCVKARFVRILEELETNFPSIIIRIFALGGVTRTRRGSLGFWKVSVSGFVAKWPSFLTFIVQSRTIYSERIRFSSWATLKPCEPDMDSFPRTQEPILCPILRWWGLFIVLHLTFAFWWWSKEFFKFSKLRTKRRQKSGRRCPKTFSFIEGCIRMRPQSGYHETHPLLSKNMAIALCYCSCVGENSCWWSTSTVQRTRWSAWIRSMLKGTVIWCWVKSISLPKLTTFQI